MAPWPDDLFLPPYAAEARPHYRPAPRPSPGPVRAPWSPPAPPRSHGVAAPTAFGASAIEWSAYIALGVTVGFLLYAAHRAWRRGAAWSPPAPVCGPAPLPPSRRQTATTAPPCWLDDDYVIVHAASPGV